MSREGSGYVVVDVHAPEDIVWNCLLDFESYPSTIPTVRDVKMFTNTIKEDHRSKVSPYNLKDGTNAVLKPGIPSVTKAAFSLSKFRFRFLVIHTYTPHPNGDYMAFKLDPAYTNLVLKRVKGVWHTQKNPENKGEVSSLHAPLFLCSALI